VQPSPRANAYDSSYLQAYAWLFPHPTANELARKASSLPRLRTLPIPVSIACASFSSIRISVSVIRPLRTLSTHRMVRSTNPLSIRERVVYQRRLLNPRVLIPTKTSRVIGPVSSSFEREPGTESQSPEEPTIRITFQVALRTSAQPRSHIIHLRISPVRENLERTHTPLPGD
jgi:hypothetical protein